MYLSISPVTAAHQGQYVCLVNETNMDILRTYDLAVTGGKHAVMCILYIVHTFAKFEKPTLCKVDMSMWHNLQQTPCLCLSVASFVYEINAVQGSTIYLPCNIPQSSQILANALWYKETDTGQRIYFRDGASGEMERMQQLYPLDYDQSVMISNVVTEDSGTYHCESPEGEKLSTVQVTVKGWFIFTFIS